MFEFVNEVAGRSIMGPEEDECKSGSRARVSADLRNLRLLPDLVPTGTLWEVECTVGRLSDPCS